MSRAGDVFENPITGERPDVARDGGPRRRYYHPLQKDWATFLETSEETGGERTLIEVEVTPGGGNAPTTTRPTPNISRCWRAFWR